MSLSALLTPRGVSRVAFRTLPVNAEYCFLPCSASSSHCLPCCLGGAGQTEWQCGRVSLDSGNEVRQSTVRFLFTHDLAHRSGWQWCGPWFLVDVAADQWKQSRRWSRSCFSSSTTTEDAARPGSTRITKVGPRRIFPLCPCAPAPMCPPREPMRLPSACGRASR